jgi:hypothetical protein
MLRRLAVGVTGAFLLAVALPAAAVPLDPNGTFVDDDASVHEADIEALYEAGITKGCNPPTNDAFCPDRAVTRGEMATFLVRSMAIAGIPVADPDPDRFVDDDASVHVDTISAIGATGVSRGCNPPANDRFCPDDDLTRGQMAAFLVRAFGYTDDDPTDDRFGDDDTSEFEGDIEALATAGVTLGCNPPANDRFCPDDPVTRGQMASFIVRALGLSPLLPPTVEDAVLVRPFFLLDQPEGGPFLASLARYVPAGEDTPERAVTELLAGLAEAETSQTPAFSTTVPEGTELLGLTVAAGVATVDLSENFDDGGGSASMFGRLGQLTFTLLDFDEIDEVMVELEGVPVTVFSSEGIDISGGLDPAFFFDTGVLPELLPTSPAWFEFLGNEFTVQGWGRSFEAQFSWELYDDDGALLSEGIAMGGAGPDWGSFTFDVAYVLDRRQVGTLTLVEFSAQDGSRINVRETAVWLEP